MSTLTYLTEAAIRDNVQTLEGEVISRPALLKTDGTVMTWAADVRISTTDTRGREWGEGKDPVLNPDLRILRTVPIAPGNRSLAYADVGAAVSLTRTRFGRFEITGFSKTKPGRRIRVPVDLTTATPGPAVDAGVTVRPLTLAELSDPAYGTFGTTPFGSFAVFVGTTLVEVRS